MLFFSGKMIFSVSHYFSLFLFLISSISSHALLLWHYFTSGIPLFLPFCFLFSLFIFCNPWKYIYFLSVYQGCAFRCCMLIPSKRQRGGGDAPWMQPRDQGVAKVWWPMVVLYCKKTINTRILVQTPEYCYRSQVTGVPIAKLCVCFWLNSKIK